jgi:hypothetical protein
MRLPFRRRKPLYKRLLHKMAASAGMARLAVRQRAQS